MYLIFFLICCTFSSFAIESIDIPKESYLTFDQFLLEQSQKNTNSIRAPEHWIKLKYKAPLVGKYQVDSSTVLSISVFKGSIGNDLSNLNRWRSQLNLTPLKSLPDNFRPYQENGLTFKQFNLNNNSKYFTIYWIQDDDKHIFNKFESNRPISDRLIRPFIEGQTWSNI